MRRKTLIFCIAVLAAAVLTALFTPAEAQKPLSVSSNFPNVSHLDSASADDSNATWDTLGMRDNERLFNLRLPVAFNRYIFYAYVVWCDSGAGYAFDTDSAQIDLWFETSRDMKNWTQVATLSIIDKATVYSDVRFVTVGDGANDTLYQRNWRVIQRILTNTIGDQFPTDFYDTVTIAFSIEGRNVF